MRRTFKVKLLTIRVLLLIIVSLETVNVLSNSHFIRIKALKEIGPTIVLQILYFEISYNYCLLIHTVSNYLVSLYWVDMLLV